MFVKKKIGDMGCDDSRSEQMVSEFLGKWRECIELAWNIEQEYGEDFYESILLRKGILRQLVKTKKERPEDREYGSGITYAGKKWTKNERQRLKRLIGQDSTVEEIASFLGRSNYAIECALLGANLIDATSDGDRVFYSKKANPLRPSWSLAQINSLLKLFDEDVPESEIPVHLPSRGCGASKSLTEQDVVDKLENLGLIEVVLEEESEEESEEGGEMLERADIVWSRSSGEPEMKKSICC